MPNYTNEELADRLFASMARRLGDYPTINDGDVFDRVLSLFGYGDDEKKQLLSHGMDNTMLVLVRRCDYGAVSVRLTQAMDELIAEIPAPPGP